MISGDSYDTWIMVAVVVLVFAWPVSMAVVFAYMLALRRILKRHSVLVDSEEFERREEREEQKMSRIDHIEDDIASLRSEVRKLKTLRPASNEGIFGYVGEDEENEGIF